ncbi:hypothetical protein J2S20_000556 [Moryella indoligenes]|uniref:Uncharacterized protein n=1 Tax=Moryella indoligenes TaxID=371674 RepID=A0AAE3V8T0_9FIRM|nr:hypothetical protein [Moryella indoligenes]MDQ0151876.1 hypothetical protein [Moryella indoligenes]
MKKSVKVLFGAAMISVLTAMTSLAAVGWVDNGDGRWWYSIKSNNSDWYRGEIGQVKWAWIDGNQDGIAECYCFDDGGWLLMNRKTPDGYMVNAAGQWTVRGVVQTKSAYIHSSNSQD